jgi:hypothetical protein
VNDVSPSLLSVDADRPGSPATLLQFGVLNPPSLSRGNSVRGLGAVTHAFPELRLPMFVQRLLNRKV